MRHDDEGNVPIRHAGFSIRSPRAVMLLMPFQLPVTLAIFMVTIVFTIWPNALQHTAISFETQGFVHHAWHYSLLVGSVLVLVGMFRANTRRLQAELIGLFILMGSLAMNLIALVAASLPPVADQEPSGLGLAIRVGIILAFAIRVYIIITQPTVTIIEPVTTFNSGSQTTEED